MLLFLTVSYVLVYTTSLTEGVRSVAAAGLVRSAGSDLQLALPWKRQSKDTKPPVLFPSEPVRREEDSSTSLQLATERWKQAAKLGGVARGGIGKFGLSILEHPSRVEMYIVTFGFGHEMSPLVQGYPEQQRSAIEKRHRYDESLKLCEYPVREVIGKVPSGLGKRVRDWLLDDRNYQFGGTTESFEPEAAFRFVGRSGTVTLFAGDSYSEIRVNITSETGELSGWAEGVSAAGAKRLKALIAEGRSEGTKNIRSTNPPQ